MIGPTQNIIGIGDTSTSYDAAIIRILNVGIWGGASSNTILVSLNGSGINQDENCQITSVGSSAALPDRTPICKSGKVTRTTCGVYMGTDDNSHYRRVNYANCQGDSGGPVFDPATHKAYGINHGYYRPHPINPCNIDTTGWSVYQLVGQAMTAMNVSLN